MRLLVLSAVFVGALTTPAASADYDFTVWSSSHQVTKAAVNSTLAAGAEILAEVNGQDDTSCKNSFVLDGDISYDEQYPASIDSKADWLRVIEDNRFSIYVVRSIKWCGGPAHGGVFAGCARKGGPIAVAQDHFTPVVVAHEIGHAQGNLHNSAQHFLMFSRAMASNTRVTRDECDNYLVGKLFPVATEDFPFQNDDAMPMAAMVEAEVLLEDLLNSVWHSPPSDEIALLTEDNITRIRDLLSGEMNEQWPNAITILGMRGAADDFVFLEDAIRLATHALASGATDAPYLTIRANAAIALGVLYNRTEEIALLDVLRRLMTAPQAQFPELELPGEEMEDIVKSAAIGFAHAGPSATQVFPAALAQAEIGNLQIAGVFAVDGPIVASLPNQRDTIDDPSTNPSLAIVASGSEQGRASRDIDSIAGFYQLIDEIRSQVQAVGIDAYIAGGSSGEADLSAP